MKKFFVLPVLLISVSVFLITTGFRLFHVDTFVVDTGSSNIVWHAEKVTGKHNGTVQLSSGVFHNDHGKFTGSFDMNMQTIDVRDLTGGSKTKLEGHLHSADFFDTQTYPTARLEVNSVTPLSNVQPDKPNFKVEGVLTIKDIRQPISFPALIKFNGGDMTASGEMVVNRTKYDIKYRSATFIEDIGDKAISDEFRIVFDVKASRP